MINAYISERRKQQTRPREIAESAGSDGDTFSLFEKVHQPFLLWWGNPEQELLDKLEKTEARLTQTELDLNSEQNVRRTLQAEVVDAKERESALAQKQVSLPARPR